MEPKKQKRKRQYTLMVISDSAEGGIKQLLLEKGVIQVILGTLLCLITIGIGYTVYTVYQTSCLAQDNQALSRQVTELTTAKEALIVENTELSENVTLLSDTINQKVQLEEETAEKCIPDGFPLAGAASIQESSELDAGQEENAEAADEGAAQAREAAEPATPIVVFSASTGTSVVATGNGVVQAVEADEEYGSVIRVDHGNGYVSIYRNPSPAKVKTGDEITKGTMLIEMTTENEKLGYQIMKDGEYIDPLELMEIYG